MDKKCYAAKKHPRFECRFGENRSFFSIEIKWNVDFKYSPKACR